jgi:P27 family predicted phage terminase small subunit
MARKADPAGLRLLKGRSEARDSGGRLVAPSPNFVREAPEPPEWLCVEARAEWDRVVPGLERLDLLKPEDRAVLAAYCVTYARFVEAVRIYRAEGTTIVNPDSGNLRRHPAVGIAEAAAAQLRSLGAEFGLTPASERAVSPVAPEHDANNPYADPFAG